ncbi:hydroxysqualene dehydroxylase HpnE [Paucibacter sp. B2R-40]|uniref:hydroxysqualene dehydroxylase HpnE n=1 Tax=Paucibacter sp. B2R-40 TaxID=2893554 RepID=UPI0021E3D1F4|nr:hydroxysqualene dehydroxylase HpnE [Paucibacter sp. B2R-40]MCV2355041.1 hydroxysqualene dehydroxylase HpnE [Paucibacter sp. B2R-40]
MNLSAPKGVAVIGGGWAGLAAAVKASQLGYQITLFEMAPHLGGRARSLAPTDTGPRLDNGQHILIGAYQASLSLLETVGVELSQSFLRMPLRLRYPHHEGLHLPPGPPLLSFVRGILAYRAWPLAARLSLLLTATGWLLRRFDCASTLSVSTLTAGLPAIVRQELIEPLCVAALNTPADQASAKVFLRVLCDALFSGRGSADLLLPKLPLSALLAEPAAVWLSARGVDIRLNTRVQVLAQCSGGWCVDGQAFEQVLLACSSAQAASLCAEIAPAWALQAGSLHYQPIVTVYVNSPGSRLPAAMVALQEGDGSPAQFAFDLGQLGHAPGLFAFVVSGAASWVERGLAATGEAALRQALAEFSWNTPPQVHRVLAEKRATFACTPGLQRPPASIKPELWAAGDYVDGPYPATLEGAVRSGFRAANNLGPV